MPNRDECELISRPFQPSILFIRPIYKVVMAEIPLEAAFSGTFIPVLMIGSKSCSHFRSFTFREPVDEELLRFQYRVLRLWTLDAREYLEKRLIVMYTFLPAMKQATATLLIQALEEMKQFYSHSQFVRHASRFRTILHRSTTISVQDKHTVEEYMDYHYDSLLDEDPEVKEKMARSKVEALQEMALDAVKDQYPTLVELAQERVLLIRQPEMLRQLVKQIYKAPDETTARWALNTFAA